MDLYKILHNNIYHPLTEKIKEDIEYAYNTEYSKTLSDIEIEKILDNQAVKKFNLNQQITIFIKALFLRNDFGANIFDGIIIYYYEIPILYLKNKDVSDKYSISFNISNLRNYKKIDNQEKSQENPEGKNYISIILLCCTVGLIVKLFY